MKRKATAFLKRAQESLILGVELFNRPTESARTDGVLFCLDHAFEMLLKAAVLEKTGRIRGRREKVNYGLEKCLNICESDLALVSRDEGLILRDINGFRDAAVHDIVIVSEGMLYAHAQSAVQIFAAVLKKAFGKEISRVLPRRILPLATVLPAEITAVISEDLEGIGNLLGAKRRQTDDAEARLRPYMVIEGNVRLREGGTEAPPSLAKVIRGIRSGDWRTALPMVAGIARSDVGGIPLTIHMSKREGFPVRLDPSAPGAIAFKYISPEDKYPYLTMELAGKLGISTSRVVAFSKVLQLREVADYHTSIKASRTGQIQRYSEKAREVIAAAIQRNGVEKLWELWKAGKTLNPAEYRPAARQAAAAAAGRTGVPA